MVFKFTNRTYEEESTGVVRDYVISGYVFGNTPIEAFQNFTQILFEDEEINLEEFREVSQGNILLENIITRKEDRIRHSDLDVGLD